MALRVQGEGTRPIQAAQAARDFVSMLRRCSGLDLRLNADGDITEGTTSGNPPTADKATMAEAVRTIMRSDNRLVIKVRRDARRGDPIIDDYCQRRIILDHIDTFPQTPPAADPSATTRCEVLVHVMAEYAFAFTAGSVKCRKGFRNAHRAGMRAQAAYREANGQETAPPHSNDLDNGPPKVVIFRHCDGSRTIAVQNPRTGAIQVRHTRPRRRKVRQLRNVSVPKSSSAFLSLLGNHAFAFAGTIDDVEKSPGVWSNFGLAHQAVRYKDVEWIKGDLSMFSARVHHLCVKEAITMDKRPGLNRNMFSPGRRIVVFCDLEADPEVKGGLRLEANEPDSFLELVAPESDQERLLKMAPISKQGKRRDKRLG